MINWRSTPYHISSLRINALEWGIFLLIIAIMVRLFFIQVVDHSFYVNQGLTQRMVTREIDPERGRIFALASDQSDEWYPLAVNKIFYQIAAVPTDITHPQNITDILSETLGWDDQKKGQVLEKLKKDTKYELLEKNVPRESVEIIKQKFEELRHQLNSAMDSSKQLKQVEELGIIFEKSILRYYPDEEVGSQIIGFLGYSQDGYNRAGKYGLEAYFDKELAGVSGQVIGETDVSGRLLSDNEGQQAKNGADIYLTLDRTIQYSVCKSLERAIAAHQAESGIVVVLESATGAIKAMCGYPSYDPNNYGDFKSDFYNNQAVFTAYEPGSIMKVISLAIALDQGKITPTTLFKDEGEVKFAGGLVIKNAGNQKYGLVDMKEVLSSSINTGVVFATSQINNSIYKEYMDKFGFGELTGLKISQEASGDIESLSKKGDIYKATASYGQGITVTPIQMASAINAIANNGLLMQPYLIKKLEYDNKITEEYGPKPLRQVVTKSTAAQMSAMMVNTVDVGHSKKAGVEGYFVAGKTGTAQVANPETGRYYSDRTIHSFVGFAPSDNPKFTMIVKLDHPKTAPYAENTAAPLFGEISKFLLEYYQIPPRR